VSDRELLELAAKAVGGEFSPGTSKRRIGPTWETWEWIGPQGIRTGPFNSYPLTNDGDALRLAVNLGMCVDHGYECAFASLTIVYDEDSCKDALHAEAMEDYASHSGDAFAATRRAIVRAAAEIGKTITP
jgi:hypothetical protein